MSVPIAYVDDSRVLGTASLCILHVSEKYPVKSCVNTDELSNSATEQGLSRCTPDYCFCGGITVPLLAPTGSVTSSNCDYSTQPASEIDLGTVLGCTATSAPAGNQTGSSAPASSTLATSVVPPSITGSNTTASGTSAPSISGSGSLKGATVVTEAVSNSTLAVTYTVRTATLQSAAKV